MKVNNTQEPIQIIIENNAPEIKPDNVQMSIEDDGNQQNFHSMKLSNESFRAVVIPVRNERLEVYLHVDKRPTKEKYLFKWELPDNSTCQWINETKHANETLDLLLVDWNETSCSRDPYSVFVSDSNNIDGVVYLGKFKYCFTIILRRTIRRCSVQ